ncbi:MAG TPA: GNAT family protein [Vicinamibacterales bacterium]|nr:GNAT family protein [Vicinamibacterales bacterium]
MVDKALRLVTTTVARDLAPRDTVCDWRFRLPVLSSGELVLREVRASDAHSLVALLTTPEITRFISPPPQTVDGFERFIAASQRMRAMGEGACFAVTLRDYDTAIGLFQVRQVNPSEDEARQLAGAMDTAEWGFALGSPFWGAGIFEQGAALVIEFAFTQLRVRRLEARCAVKNGRGGRALLKVGAAPEGVLRKAFVCGDEHLDQMLYAIIEHDWRACRDRARSRRLRLVH